MLFSLWSHQKSNFKLAHYICLWR